MRNLYGNRSIIPNNYYFTFDKIYENEEQVNTAHNDGILIGRAVLAYAEHTVWLKTNLGYIKVAKLDNEGRFAYLEGKVLTEEDNIDLIHSNGNSYNDDGIYIINKNDYAKTELTEEGIVYHIPQGTYPKIMGSDKYATYNGNNIIDDNSQRTFLLEQYSNIVTTQKNNNYWESVTWEQAPNIQGTTLYQEMDLSAAKYVNPTELSTQEHTTYYYPIKFDVETYQIMTDISVDNQADNKAVDTSIQAKLSHNNKIFIRKCTFTYDIATKTEEAIYQYTFDSGNSKMIGTGVATSVNETTNTIFKKSIKGNWSNWEDISEQYTGYLGALNGTGFNHVNTKFVGKDGKTHSGQGDYLTLVDTINQLDKVIGSTNLRFKSSNTIQGDATDEGVQGTDLAQAYSVASPGDKRKIKLKADNLANAIIRLGLNVGQFEDDINDDINNIKFLNTVEKSLTKNTDSTKAIVHSLTDFVKVLNTMIGDYDLIDNNLGNRPVHGENGDGTGQPISETLQHILADLGIIETFTGQNNFNYSADEEEANVTTDKDGSIYSVVSAIKQLNNMIGDYSTIDKNLNNRPVHIEGGPISETIQHLQADTGEIENFTSTNTKNFYFANTSTEPELTTTDKAQVSSIEKILKVLDTIIGQYNTIDEKSYDNRPNILNFENITNNLKYLAANTGEIDNNDYKGKNFVYNNLAAVNIEPTIGPTASSWQGSIESLTDVIKLLDNIIGSFNTRENSTNQLQQYNNIIDILNFLSTSLGNVENLDEENGINKNNLVEAINTLNTLIGNLANFKDEEGNQIIDPSSGESLISYIYEMTDWYEKLRRMVNNLGENLDILDLNVTNLMNSGGSNVNLEWGSF